MKILINVVIVLVVIIAALLITALFTKKSYFVEKEIVINKPKNEVFDYVKYLKNQNKYSKWANMDPNMQTSFRGTDGTPGFISAWNSNQKNVGKGEQEIKKITAGERIDYEIRFIKPFPSTAPSYMITESLNAHQTKVKWAFAGTMTYPMNLMLLFMDMNKMIGDDLQVGLTNLKGIIENNAQMAQIN
ncbi:SRPBCC family protein [Mucilaginibacter lacusdianchii]|uniref:SRPBCC family protein n=1 Tax=Mucilaginibacter lacusdianchii TaxID=2684211 RepID=UPI00131C1C1A|nr:SRPBCC family protein [Mucilaginibacter sp. JXJ CY 39]